jgi:ABC-2 type transport system permease protein
MELKSGSSVDWLKTAGGRMFTAVVGKLLPQTIAFCAVGLFILWAMIGWCHFPQNGNVMWLIADLILMVIASQAFALLISSLVPNPRMAFSVTALISILTFSFAGFSFPVTSMYGAIAIFSYIVPVRHFFLIYLNQALNGFDIYYVRYSFVALLIFPLIACLLLKRLKRACANPVYVP